MPQTGGGCHPGVLGHSGRGSQPGKSHIPSDNSFNVTLSGPLPTSKALFIGIDVLSVRTFNMLFN
jgi:hypothetical protein